MLDKTYDPAELEARYYPLWEASGVLALRGDPAQTPFTIMMPPPNVTGSLHIGHALNHTLQDILIRYQRMRGHDVLWQPGTDHAGIATQMVVERQLEAAGESRKGLGREAFVARVWEWKAQSGDTITRQLRRLGTSPAWSRERFTMDEGLSRAVRKVFVELYRQGLIYRDKRLVNWDPKLHTAISDLEVVQRETKGHLWHFRYPIEGVPGRHITVATTRPETMLGDTAVAVHPDDDRYRDLVGRHALLPFVGRRLPIVADPHSDPEKGTGAVKITPGHDFNDFEVGRRHNLDIVNIFDADARLNDAVPTRYRGLDRFEARARIVADMEAEGLLDRIVDHVHTVPHGDRSGVVVEPWLTDQWFADAAALAAPAIAAVEDGRTRFVPETWANTYFEWMRNIQPWCISRQLWWGHQIPAWYGPDGAVFVAADEAGAKAAAHAHYGEERALRRDEDVLDTWFSSALWPFSTLGWPEETPELKRYYPTDVLVTSFDIIFFWVARMMMMGLHFMGEVPFHTIYIHALVRDAQGQKMSKSKGNVVDPLEMAGTYGVDALRFTLAAMAAQGRDIKLDENRVAGYRNFATKLWNAARFAEMYDCTPAAAFDPGACGNVVNRWIVGETASSIAQVDAALTGYRFNDAAGEIYRFAWHVFCDWYLELAKPALAGDDADLRDETRATTAWVLMQLVHLLHPFMPYLSEEIWRHLGGGEALLIGARWPEVPAEWRDAEAKAELDALIDLLAALRSVRAELNVAPKAVVNAHPLDPKPAFVAFLERHRARIQANVRVELGAPKAQAAAKGLVQVTSATAVLGLDLGGHVDFARERVRLERELERLGGEVAKIERKLANPDFVARAPEDVIETQRQRRDEAAAARATVERALARIGTVS